MAGYKRSLLLLVLVFHIVAGVSNEVRAHAEFSLQAVPIYVDVRAQQPESQGQFRPLYFDSELNLGRSNGLSIPIETLLFALSVAVVGAIVRANGEHANISSDPLPRPVRWRKRAKSDRGLPEDDQLRSLADDYLEQQRLLWPDIAKAGLLAASLSEMVDDFKLRHRGEPVTPHTIEVFLKYCSKLGGNYNRFSSDNSNPTSINDQLANALKKAKLESVFVPWSYVFADYSESSYMSTVRKRWFIDESQALMGTRTFYAAGRRRRRDPAVANISNIKVVRSGTICSRFLRIRSSIKLEFALKPLCFGD